MSNRRPNQTALFTVSHIFLLTILLNTYSIESKEYYSTKPDIRFLTSEHVFVQIKVSPVKEYLLDLRLNHNLNDDLLSMYDHRNSTPNKKCHFDGNVHGSKLPSLATISLCNGLLNGLLEADARVYRLHQSDNRSRVHVSLQSKHQLHCGVQDTSKSENIIERYRRSTGQQSDNDVLNRTRFVELVIVNDYGIYLKYAKNIDFINERSKQIVNIVNSLYMPMNIHIVLTGVVIWTEKNEIEISSDSSEMLNNFLKYRKDVLLEKYPNDNAQLITSKSFDSGVVGKALKQTMCTYEYSGGVNSDYSESISLVATTIAHELGHNFGMEHDHSDCDCPGKTCIMGPSSSFPTPTDWSSCSVEQLKSALRHGIDMCLFNRPRTVFKPSCGNGIVDEHEQCDCGPEKSCTNPCCDAKTCTFKPEAKCANGNCCNLETCQLMSTRQVCRPSRSICDIEEYCDGQSEVCPDDNIVKDGTECNSGYAYCASGECRDRESQCQLLWGDSSGVGEYRCYQHNLNATSSGNCGFNQRTRKYIPCETVKDSICGRLHCTHPAPEKLKFGPEGAATISVSKEVRRGKVIMCHSVMIDIGLDQQDPGLVPDGAKCGANAMCYKQKCVPTSRFLLEKPCPYNCHGNGRCDNNGNCHCFDGFSSYDCSSRIGRILTITIYVFFFAILPILLVILVLKFCKVNIKNWFSRSHFGKQKDYHNSKKTFSAPVGKGDISMPLQSLNSQLNSDQMTTTFPSMIATDIKQPPPLPRSAPVAIVTPRQAPAVPNNHSHLQPTRPAPPVPGPPKKPDVFPKPEVPSKPQLKPMTSLGNSSLSSSFSNGTRPSNPPPPPPPVPSHFRVASPMNQSTNEPDTDTANSSSRFGVTLRPTSASRMMTPPPPVPPHKPSLQES